MAERPESVNGAAWPGELFVFAAGSRPALAEQLRDFAAHVIPHIHLARPLADAALR